VLYRPERSHSTAPQPVPAGDHELIDRVLSARADPIELPRLAAIPLIPDDEIDACAAPAGPLPDGAYRVRLALGDHEDRRLAPGERRPLYVRVTNAGDVRWPWGLEQDPQIRVAYHWRHASGELLTAEGLRSPLPVPLGPDETAIVAVWVDAPAAEGSYLLDIDLVHEHVRWFDDPLTVELRVAEREPRLAPAATRGQPC
jgi:hypothetical protein